MPEKKRAAPTRDRLATQEDQRTEILADADEAGKQSRDAASVASAWRRWRSAFRVAVHALLGPQ